jgi:hypothetical protein
MGNREEHRSGEAAAQTVTTRAAAGTRIPKG